MILYLPLFMMVCWVQSISAPNPNEAHHASSSSSSNPSALPPSYSSLDVSIVSAPWMDTAPEGDSASLRYEWSSTSTPRPPSSNPSEQPSAEVTSPHAASGIYTTTQVMSQLPEYAEVALLEVHTTTWSPPSMTEHPPTPPSPFNSNLWYRNQKPPWEDPTCSDYFRTLPTIRLQKAMIFYLKSYCGPYIASPDAEEVKFYLNMAIARAIEGRTRFFKQYYGSVWTESAMESTIDVLENSSGYFLSSTFDPGTRRLDPKWPQILQMKMARALEITMPLCQCPFRIDSEETHFMSVGEVKYWFNKLNERAKKLVSQYRGD